MTIIYTIIEKKKYLILEAFSLRANMLCVVTLGNVIFSGVKDI